MTIAEPMSHADAAALPVPHLLFSPILTRCVIPHAFTTRQGGLSRGIFSSLNFGNPGDLPAQERDSLDTIHANRALVSAAIGASGRDVVEVHQVHSASVHIVRRGEPSHPQPSDSKADALVTNDPARLIAVRTADCTPILLASADGAIVAAVHAGWRGVILGVLPAAIAAMRDLGARDILAAIGPSITMPYFEVGPEVAGEFTFVFGEGTPIVKPHPANPGKYCIDLKLALHHQAEQAGVTTIDTLLHCTVAMPDLFFSHRRDAGRTGRMMAVIGPRSER